MIKSYADKRTVQFASNGKHKSVASQISKRTMMRLVQLDNATCLDDLRNLSLKIPTSNHLEKLIGDNHD